MLRQKFDAQESKRSRNDMSREDMHQNISTYSN